MATIFTDKFNSYSDGELDGQGSWDGATEVFTVEGTTVYEGEKALTWTAGFNDKIMKKVGTARADGRITWYVKTAAINKRAFFILREGATDISYLAFTGDFGTAGHCYLNDGGWSYDLGAYSTSDWNCCEIEWRSSDHKVRARINAGYWTAWGTAITTWTTGIDTFAIDTNGPSGTFFVDTIQENPYPSTSTLRDYWNTNDGTSDSITSTSWQAQTITPSENYILRSVKLKINNSGGTGTVTVSIRNTSGGKPTGIDLITGTLDYTSIVNNTFNEITFSGGLFLTSGTQYAIQVKGGTTGANWLEDYQTAGYAGGERVDTADSGANWTIHTTQDMMFECWGDNQPISTLRDYWNTNDGTSDSITSTSWQAQTITPSLNYNINSVKVKLFNGGSATGTLTLSIRATSGGKPTGGNLCFGVMDISTISGTATWYTISLGTGTLLSSGTQYAIQITGGTSYVGWQEDYQTAGYSGGMRVDTSDSGANWYTHATQDMMFECWGTPETKLISVKSKIKRGGVPNIITSKSKIRRFGVPNIITSKSRTKKVVTKYL